MKTNAMQVFSTVAGTFRKLGPYVLLEVLLPGGTLFALALFVYRRPATLRRYVRKARVAAARLVARVRKTTVSCNCPVSGSA